MRGLAIGLALFAACTKDLVLSAKAVLFDEPRWS